MKIKFYSIVILLTFLTSCENYAQQKNDLQKEKLSGKVKSIKVNSFSAIEKFGEIVKGEKLIGSPTNIDGYSDNNEQINFNEKGFIVVSKNDFINITYSYNTKNQIIEENRYSKDGSILYSKKTFIYAKDKLKEEKTFDYNPTESITEKVINFYDGLGNLMKSINYNGNGKLSSEVIYKYDKFGNQIEIKGLDSIGETSFLTKYKFDSRKNQIEERDFNEDGSFKLIKKKFDNYQNILEINTQDMPIVAYTGNISKFKYSNNLVIEYTHLSGPGDEVYEEEKYLYFFDKNKNWIKKTIIKNGIPKKIIERTIEYYK
jgi:hypothetical protein